jgi:malate dehydrogenase (oxaloacetate-decarboxylating)(NADP+)
MDVFQESLKYHAAEPAGKFSVEPTKPMNSQKDLSLAYSPGVAQPCLEISKGNGLKKPYFIIWAQRQVFGHTNYI